MSETITAYALASYNGSRDYALLATLARSASIICIVDYHFRDLKESWRDVCCTNYSSRRGSELWQLSARGISYLTAFDEAEFIRRCESLNVEFFVPPQ